MTLLEKVQAVFPDVLVEQDGDGININTFLRLDPCKITVKRIGGEMEVDGYVVTLDSGEDAEELAKDLSVGAVLIQTARWYAGWKASEVLAKIDTEEFANEPENATIRVWGPEFR